MIPYLHEKAKVISDYYTSMVDIERGGGAGTAKVSRGLMFSPNAL